jgi:antitoxin (DNA-binding transcriptional repressor) of toxin-antitoxin stability system
MTTVTAKKLRDNLSQYLDKLEKGEEIVLIRHSEIIGSLKPADQISVVNGSAIAAMLKRNKDFFKANGSLTPEGASTKDLYHLALDERYST